MEELGKIGVGVLLFVITSITAYLFRMRQLYVTSPKLYRHASISNDGSMCEVLIFNRGNQVEEDIRVDLPPELKCELLAASATGVSLSSSTLQVERLHKLKSVSVMLLVDNGILDISKMAVSSKNTAGRVVKNQDAIPPNYAFVFVSCALFLVLAVGAFGLPAGLERAREEYTKFKLAKLVDSGWTSLGSYITSDLRESYSDQEFPLKFESGRISGNQLRANFSVYNKTAIRMKVYADRTGKNSSSSAQVDIENFSSVEVPAMSTGRLEVRMPYSPSNKTTAEFSIYMGERIQAQTIYTFVDK